MKRTLAILLCTLLLIPAFAVCASASEVYTFRFDADHPIGEYILSCNEAVPNGIYTVTYYRNGTPYVSKEPLTVHFTTEAMDGQFLDVFCGEVVLSLFPLEETRPVTILNIDGKSYYEVDEPLTNLVVELKAVSSDGSALPSVNDALDVCIEWVGKVTTALISGELNGLLLLAAIPIAITVVMLSIKFIRRNSWGC